MSDHLSVELNVARRSISDVLGEDMKLYLQLLKSWFKQKMTREDFDHEARVLLKPESAHLHNQFLLAILTKCQSLGSSVLTGDPGVATHSSQPVHFRQQKKLKTKAKPFIEPTGVHQRFTPADPLCQTPQVQLQFPEQDDRVPEFAVHELLLPDAAMVHGRFVVSAWEFGLDGIQDDAAKLLSLAVESQLKSVMSVIVMTRKGYQLRDGCFRHSFGTQWPALSAPLSSPMHRDVNDCPTTLSVRGSQVPSMKPSVELAQRDAAVQLSCTAADACDDLQPISLFDMLTALQVYKSALPSHTVYTLNMERILNRMTHPSHEELEHDEIYRQEMNLKRELNNRQRLLCAETDIAV